ncbi:protein HEXIM1-like [Bacillus rossius redtenbacheri]|uniref:protein HEXIM1-like n=1 Tax=Bacillus rossius redtenbacheri TaxID=93214 RepID=UPI002FDD97B8
MSGIANVIDKTEIDVGCGKQNDVNSVERPCPVVPSSDDSKKLSTNENVKAVVQNASAVPVDQRRKKTRRRKSKRRRIKPYNKFSWQERRFQQDKDSNKRYISKRGKVFLRGLPVAPSNTNQFLMEDHDDVQNLDVQLKAVTTNADRLSNLEFRRLSRARDSSFSVDSDEDYFYSSPEDEGEFLTKEFKNTYQDLHVERLNNMSKTQLIQEYLQLEQRIDVLQSSLHIGNPVKEANEVSIDGDKCDSLSDESMSEQVRKFQQEMNKLLIENDQLRRENERLRHSIGKTTSTSSSSSSSSVDSESDSTTPLCSSASSCNEGDNSAVQQEETGDGDDGTAEPAS